MPRRVIAAWSVTQCYMSVRDRIGGSVTLFSEPGHLGYTRVDGPHPFGAVLRIPDPFNLDLDTSGLSPA